MRTTSMRGALAITFVAASCFSCGSGGSGGRDAVDAQDCVLPVPLCTDDFFDGLCGNGQIDVCFVQQPDVCDYMFGEQEVCDGEINLESCTEVGYLRGEVVCNDCQRFVDCGACEPSLSCAWRHGFVMGRHINHLERLLDVSGSRVAIIGESSALGTPGIAVFDGTTFVTEVAIERAISVLGVPQGWLVTSYTEPGLVPALTPMDLNGNLGTAMPLPYPGQTAYGGGRVLIAWTEVESNGAFMDVRAALADTTGRIVVDPTTILSHVTLTAIDVTTDGTNFFISVSPQLVRVASDGTFTVTSSTMPSAGFADVEWDGTTGWYRWRTVDSNWVRRFDANGAFVGEALAFSIATPINDTLANGDELLMLGVTDTGGPDDVGLYRLSSTGEVTSDPRLGLAYTVGPAELAHLGTNVVVAWNRPYLHVAIVEP